MTRFLMRLLNSLITKHRRNSIDKRIRKNLEKMEKGNYFDDQFMRYLFDACSLIADARDFNRENVLLLRNYKISSIPIEKYEARLRLDEQNGICSSIDAYYAN